MQERRSTVRVPYESRVQCCQADDFLPRDGRLFNLSERGAGVQVRTTPKLGERLTLSLLLPGDVEPWIATGLVRWSGPHTPKSRWQSLGLEWLPLEEASRHQLHRFLYAATQHVSARPAAAPIRFRWPASVMRSLAIGLALCAAAVAGGALYLWVLSLRGENQLLTNEVSHRDNLIGILQQHNTRLAGELGTAKSSLAVTTAEVVRLDHQAQQLGTEIQQLTAGVDEMQRSYVQVREERDQLTQQVLGLEQERATLERRLSSVEELRLAIGEAIEARRQAREVQQQLLAQERRAADLQFVGGGNQGYLIREGRPTSEPRGGRGGLVIRVLNPQPSPQIPAPSPQASEP